MWIDSELRMDEFLRGAYRVETAYLGSVYTNERIPDLRLDVFIKDDRFFMLACDELGFPCRTGKNDYYHIKWVKRSKFGPQYVKMGDEICLSNWIPDNN